MSHLFDSANRTHPTLKSHFLEDFTRVTSILMCVRVVIALNETYVGSYPLLDDIFINVVEDEKKM